MTIEIHQPKLEALIEQRMRTGHYNSVEDVLLQALDAPAHDAEPSPKRNNLLEVFAEVRGLADDLDFSRDPSAGREIDLS